MPSNTYKWDPPFDPTPAQLRPEEDIPQRWWLRNTATGEVAHYDRTDAREILAQANSLYERAVPPAGEV